MRANLAQMVRLSQAAGARVLLVGIRLPAELRAALRRAVRRRSSPHWRRRDHLPLVPFLLQDVALDPALMQEDGMHPNAAGEPVVLENVWPHLKPLLNKNH